MKLGSFIGRLRQLGCPIALDNHFLLWATMIYRSAQMSKFKSEVSYHQSYQTNYIYQKLWPNYLQTNIFWLFNCTQIFCYSSMFGQPRFYGQACPTGQPRKKKLSQPVHWTHKRLVISLAVLLNYCIM